MTTNVPSPESFADSFPETIPQIQGVPTYEALAEVKAILKNNAASVPTPLGGGAHGYLGLVLPNLAYYHISQHPFVRPPYPGPEATWPLGATGPQIAAAERVFVQHTRAWRECTNVEQALKKQLIACVDAIYLRAQRNRHTGFANVEVNTILQFLFDTYGKINPQELAANEERMKEQWDSNQPFETLIDQIEDAVELAEAGNQAFTPAQVLTTSYNLVYNTGLFFEDCKTWNRKPALTRTWENFKLHFLEAQQSLRLQQQTAQQAGFHGANQATVENQLIHEETATALANLATARQTEK